MSEYRKRNLPTAADVARLIDHTILNPEATREDVLRVAGEAAEHGCAAVCVNPMWVMEVHEALKGSSLAVCSVVGFPLGATRPQSVAFEADRAVREGATEIDMVLPLGRARNGEWEAVRAYIATVKAAIGATPLKVILETAVLDAQEISRASQVALEAGADFLKTSTGFNKAGGATVEAVRLLAEAAGDRAGVKAAGGIRDFATLRSMVEAGATRIGASSTLAILEQAAEELGS
jgi:deoxyribose-phosphate aldolase